MVYVDKDDFAKAYNYADWTAYTTDITDAPTLAHLNDLITEATDIINQYIGCYNTDITDTRFLSRVQRLCLRMVLRMRQVEMAQGKFDRIPMFSPNDFLIDRERNYLMGTVGVLLGHREIGDISS